MAALAADLEAVCVAVQAAVEKEGSWDDGDWSVFVEDVVSFLLKVGEKRSKVVAAAVGLIVYGANTREKLQGVAGQPPDQKNFRDTLTADKYGVPAAICDMCSPSTWPARATGGVRAAAASWAIGRSSAGSSTCRTSSSRLSRTPR
jgi:hypothetical protein